MFALVSYVAGIIGYNTWF